MEDHGFLKIPLVRDNEPLIGAFLTQEVCSRTQTMGRLSAGKTWQKRFSLESEGI